MSTIEIDAAALRDLVGVFFYLGFNSPRNIALAGTGFALRFFGPPDDVPPSPRERANLVLRRLSQFAVVAAKLTEADFVQIRLSELQEAVAHGTTNEFLNGVDEVSSLRSC